MKKYDAVIAGYLCVDLIPDFKKNGSFSNISDFFKPGKLIEIEGLEFVPGGAVANTGLAMKKFDKRIFLNGLTGDDFIGKFVRSLFEKHELSEGIITTNNAGTAYSIVIAPPGIDRIFLESPGCNQIFDKNFINFEAVSQSRLFHFGYPPLLRKFYLDEGKQLVEMFSEVKRCGVVTSLDFSLPDPESESGKINWPGIMQNVFPYVDIFAPSLEELLMIMDPLKYAQIISSADSAGILDQVPLELIREIGKKVIRSGVKILLIKAGHRGAYLLTGNVSAITNKTGLNLNGEKWNNCELWCNAYKADPLKTVNSSGAGDTAIAAFLSAILNCENPDSSVRYAAMAGRNNLYCKDSHEDLSSWQEMSDEISYVVNELVYY
jgi:sugar/nucleoside kinase (ribokinase family)